MNKIDEILIDFVTKSYQPASRDETKAQLLAELEKCMPEYSPSDEPDQFVAVVRYHRHIRKLFEEEMI
jgi:hypothetical protein